MGKLLSIIILILAIVLFPPAALAVISNNAVPGDATYPIKRALEDAIFAAVSLHPVTKAWFAAARSDRRFKEFTTLVTQGKKTSDVLNELVEQTQIAASQIANVSNEDQKEKLVEQLAQSIEKYDQGLAQLTPIATPQPQVADQPIPITTAQSTTRPTAQPTPRPTLVPTPQPTPVPSQDDQARQREIEEARRKLEEIKRKLEEEQRQRLHRQESRPEIKQEDKQESKRENEKKTEDKSKKEEDTKDHSKKDKD